MTNGKKNIDKVLLVGAVLWPGEPSALWVWFYMVMVVQKQTSCSCWTCDPPTNSGRARREIDWNWL